MLPSIHQLCPTYFLVIDWTGAIYITGGIELKLVLDDIVKWHLQLNRFILADLLESTLNISISVETLLFLPPI